MNKIRNLIADDQLEESLNELDALTAEKNYELQNAIISLRRRLKDLKRGELSGALSYQDITQEKARINDALLDLLSEMEGAPAAAKTTSASKPAAPAPNFTAASATNPAPSGSKKMIGIIVGGIALVALLVFIFTSSDPGSDQPEDQFIEQQLDAQPSEGTFEQSSGEPAPGEMHEQSTEGSQQETPADNAESDTIWLDQQEQTPNDISQ